MLNLAVVDNLVLIIWCNQRALIALCRFPGVPCDAYLRFRPAFIYYGWAVGSTVHMMATWSIVAITCSRFMSVCWATRATHYNVVSKVKVRIIIMYVLCAVFNIPRFAEVYVGYDEEGQMYAIKTKMKNSPIFAYLYSVVLYYIFIYVLPLSCLIYFTVRLCISLQDAQKRRSQMTTKAQQNIDLTFSLVIVVIVFIICQMPNPIRRLLSALYPHKQQICGTVPFYFSSWAGIGVTFSSACNFFVFCLCGRGFRRRLKQLFTKTGRVAPMTAPITFTTRSTTRQRDVTPANSTNA
jgi:hypothetical protein